MKVRLSRLVPCLCCMASLPCTAQQVPDLSACSVILDNPSRLACYDRAVARQPSLTALPQRQAAASAASAADSETAERPQQASIAATQEAPADNSFLIDYWELDPAHKRGLFNFRPHAINYLIANYSWRPNDAPYRPFRSVLPASTDLSRSELVYQLGFKMKLAQDVLNKPLDLWFAYTQNSFWQAGNRDASSPFRETNYQPEVMAVAPLHLDLLGVNAFHQSGPGAPVKRTVFQPVAQLEPGLPATRP
jgi:phospholipase A1/A2